MNLKVLNSRQKRRLSRQLSEDYGVDEGLLREYVVLQSGGDAWVASELCLTLGLDGLNVDSVGLRFMHEHRPTVHGIQLLFRSAQTTGLDEADAKAFIAGRVVANGGPIVSYNGSPLDAAVQVPGGYKRQNTND